MVYHYVQMLFLFLLINDIINMNFLCERKKGNMEKFKDYISKNKKIVISVIVMIVLVIVCVSFYFATQPMDEPKQEEQQTKVQEVKKEDLKPLEDQEVIINVKDDEETEKGETEEENSNVITSETKDTITKNNQEQVDKNDGENFTPITSISGNSNNNANSGNASEPTHTHTWVDHNATKQVWVPNMVTVDDYETQTIYGARFYTYSSVDDSYIANGPTYWFENGFTQDNLKAIIVEGLKNADEHGLYNGVYYGNYQNVSKTEKVKIGSHQEDHGHYENQTYVDYQYCSECGQKK